MGSEMCIRDRHDEGLEDIRRGRTTVTTKDTQSARLPLLPRTWGCPRKKCVRSPVDSSSFGSSAALPFTDKISSTRGLAKGQIDQDRKDGCTIQKAQGPISTAGTAPHKVGARGRGNYGSSASRGLGVVVEIFPFCECLNLCRFLRYTMLRRLAASGTAIPARSLPIACTRRCVLESSCWIPLYLLYLDFAASSGTIRRRLFSHYLLIEFTCLSRIAEYGCICCVAA